MEPSEERRKTNRVAWKVNTYVVGFFVLGVIAASLFPQHKEWAMGGVGALFAAVSAFLVGYYRGSELLAGRNLTRWQVIAIVLIYLLPAAVSVTQMAATGDPAYVLMVATGILAAETLFVVAPLMLGRRFGYRRSART